MVGEQFTVGGNDYEVIRVEEVGKDLPVMRERLIENNKEPRVYYAGKILASGKISQKQTGMFYRFNNGLFIKVL